ncbi:MAG TPA: peptidoglycan DD-metalloendopeptidase family protein [Gammaproteobacteria bacterium]|nr:peptidoglycan DD-metalloendopeptidase family protein [Gammaproteobacteria bacterium]
MPGFRICRYLLAILCLGFTAFAVADNPDSARQVKDQSRKLEAIRGQIRQIQSELTAREEQRNSLLSELRIAETGLNKTARKLHDLNRNTAAAKAELAGLVARRVELQTRLNRNRQLLAAQLRAAYFSGGQERIKLLLNQQDPAALARVTRYYEYLTSARLDLMQSTRETLAGLALVETGIADNTQAMKYLKLQYETEHQTWSQLRVERQQLLSRLDSQIKESADTIDRLKADQARIQELIASLTGIFSDIPGPLQAVRQFAQLKGSLSLPVRGPLLNRYGQKRAAGSDLIWQGVNIGAQRGSEVKAISRGRVAFADWLPGLGLMMIIDHGQGYMSLYGHNEALFKETGDWSEAGEVIATVGDSGGRTQTALYFEVRHQGTPVNPLEWCQNTKG